MAKHRPMRRYMPGGHGALDRCSPIAAARAAARAADTAKAAETATCPAGTAATASTTGPGPNAAAAREIEPIVEPFQLAGVFLQGAEMILRFAIRTRRALFKEMQRRRGARYQRPDISRQSADSFRRGFLEGLEDFWRQRWQAPPRLSLAPHAPAVFQAKSARHFFGVRR